MVVDSQLLTSVQAIESIFIAKVPPSALPDGTRCFKTEAHCIRTDEERDGVLLFSTLFPRLAHVFDLERMEHADTGAVIRSVFIRFRACFGLLWVVALSSCPNTRLDVIRHNRLVGLRFTECSEGCESFATVALILPYACLQCGVWAPTMRKCERCWASAGVCARYCGKECQRAHYPTHRGACGCAHG